MHVNMQENITKAISNALFSIHLLKVYQFGRLILFLYFRFSVVVV
jgi:hypothetical protein